MDFVIKLLTVLGLGIVEIWVAVPVGLALGLNPLLTGTLSAIGGIIGIFIVFLAGQRIRNWLARRRGGVEGSKPGRLHRIWARYGVVGLGLLAPLLVGAPAGTALGLILGSPGGRLLLWMGIGVLVWSAILASLGALGLSIFGY